MSRQQPVPGRQRCHVVLNVEARKWVDAQAAKLGLSRGQMFELMIRKVRSAKMDLGV